MKAHRIGFFMLLRAATLAAVLATALPASSASDLRVIAIGGSMTEIVYALGADKSLVATDTTSIYPPEALKLPKVGYQRQLSAEGMLSLKPTVVVATTEAGPPPVVAQLKSVGVHFAQVSADHTFEELRNKVRVISEAVGKRAEGSRLDETLVHDWTAVQADIARVAAARTAKGQGKPKVLFLLLHSTTNGLMASGEGTAADAVIKYAGGLNAVSGALNFKAYKPLSQEAVIAAAPDIIVLTQQGLVAIGGMDKLLAMPGLAQTPAARAKRVYAPDALFLLGFGPRLPQAVKELSQQLQAL